MLEISGVSKDYHALRPLRIRQLTVAHAEHVAILGLDRLSAEVFVNLVTGATLPDTGAVQLFGRATSAIADSADWLAVVDRFGIVSERAVLLDQLSVVQNLAMPFTLEIEPPPDDVRQRAEALALEVGLDRSVWASPVANANAAAKARIRLARALALEPEVLLLEHPTADLDPGSARALGVDVRAIAGRRQIAVIALTADETFARAVASRVLTLQPASGRLAESGPGWFRRLLG